MTDSEIAGLVTKVGGGHPSKNTIRLGSLFSRIFARAWVMAQHGRKDVGHEGAWVERVRRERVGTLSKAQRESEGERKRERGEGRNRERGKTRKRGEGKEGKRQSEEVTKR